MNDAKNKIYST